jgi:uncharacterized protein YndB with AHSA1/START domain
MTDTIPTEVAENDLLLKRVFNAPVDVVWKFWTEPEYLAKWFGPTQVHIDLDTVNIEMKPGGRWDLDMVDNESGEHYPMRAKLVEVVPLQYFLGTEDQPRYKEIEGIDFLRVTFRDLGDKTEVTLHQGPFTEELKKMTSDGWNESFLKIDAILAAGVA